MQPAPATRDRTVGLLIVIVSFLGAPCVSWWAREASAPASSEPPGPPTTDGVAGYPNAVDVLSTLEAARKITQREELLGFVASGVASDGTLDVTDPGARIRYAFGSERGEGPQPPRPPGTLPSRSHCGRQNVHVRREGLIADPDLPTANCSAKARPLPDPRCGPKEVWAKAIENGAPKDQRARIEYYRATAGPAWRFEIPGTPHRFTLYGDCGAELKPHESAGSVP